jgi:hypothetical protein
MWLVVGVILLIVVVAYIENISRYNEKEAKDLPLEPVFSSSLLVFSWERERWWKSQESRQAGTCDVA